MKAYFTASIVGKKFHLDHYRRIVDILRKKGLEVIADHILNVDEKDINLQSKDERLNFHKRLENWITSADIMVVESSFPSISVGYEISMALNRNKPVLVVYNEGDPPSLFAYHQNERIVCEKYTDATLEPIIEEFITFAGGASDTRFTFFLTSELAHYLDEIARQRKVPKSVYVRHLISQDRKKNSET